MYSAGSGVKPPVKHSCVRPSPSKSTALLDRRSNHLLYVYPAQCSYFFNAHLWLPFDYSNSQGDLM